MRARDTYVWLDPREYSKSIALFLVLLCLLPLCSLVTPKSRPRSYVSPVFLLVVVSFCIFIIALCRDPETTLTKQKNSPPSRRQPLAPSKVPDSNPVSLHHRPLRRLTLKGPHAALRPCVYAGLR